jgi:hypothetical protein
MKHPDQVDAEFAFKLGVLLGTLDDFLIRVAEGNQQQGDIDRIKTFVKQVKIAFYETQKKEVTNE